MVCCNFQSMSLLMCISEAGGGKHRMNWGFVLTRYSHVYSGECAGHFRQILQKFPPQVSTRSTAAAWACHVHNEVNKSLNKELWDCSNIGDFYDCGCKDEEKGDEKKKQEKEQGTGKAEETEMIDLIVEKNG